MRRAGQEVCVCVPTITSKLYLPQKLEMRELLNLKEHADCQMLDKFRTCFSGFRDSWHTNNSTQIVVDQFVVVLGKQYSG